MGKFHGLSKLIWKTRSREESTAEDLDIRPGLEFEKMQIDVIVEEIRKESKDKPSNVLIRALSDALIVQSEEQYASGVKLLYCALVVREWLFAVRPGTSVARARRNPEDTLVLARGHFELWQRLGAFSDSFHLYRSRDLFKEYVDSLETYESSEDLLTYCKVLQHCGDMQTAAEIINIILTHFDTDVEYPNYLFYAGVINKAAGDIEKATNYFFEASQVGPPRYFSKLEMMVMISRILEESQGGLDENDDQAYEMVHAHLVLEGVIPEDVDCDEWISDSKTWISLADKCAQHEMYSLATDFYGLAITRDAEAFKKPMLWYRFAKSCLRCGRVSDAQLAIKVSLDPQNLLNQRTFFLQHFVDIVINQSNLSLEALTLVNFYPPKDHGQMLKIPLKH